MIRNVLISGGSGLIGSELVKILRNKNYNIALLSRKISTSDIKTFLWDYERSFIDEKSIEFADAIIHLAGENISNKRWSEKQKKKIIESRVNTTNLLFDKIKNSSKKPEVIISASAIGFYGTFNSEKIFNEDDNAGNDFLAQTVKEWEQAVMQFNEIGIRTVILRTGVVISKDGGALPKMIAPVKYGLGAALGNGKQYVPWIEISDLANLYLFTLENSNTHSIYNAVSPDYINNIELMKTIARSLNKPFFFPNLPSFVMKLIYGEMSDILLKGSRVSSKKIEEAGFEFNYTDINSIMDSYFRY